MHRLTVALVLSAAVFAGCAADAAETPRVAEVCIACHGEKPAQGAPAIAGQGSNFLQWQLVFFRTGRRKNELMQGIASGLSDADIKSVGAYFGALPVPAAHPPNDAQAALTDIGKTLSEQRHCTSCHGDGFVGQQAAPRLIGLPEEYLAKALRDYRSGARPSSGGAVMTEVAGGLSDDDITAVSHAIGQTP